MDKKEARPGSLDPIYDCSITWRHIAPGGVTMEDVLQPSYWSNVAREAGQQRVLGRHAWNRIEVLAENGTWECELRVLSIEQGLVQTRLLREWKQPVKAKKIILPKGYTVDHVAGNGWRAIAPNGDPVTTNKPTEEAAAEAAVAHARMASKDAA